MAGTVPLGTRDFLSVTLNMNIHCHWIELDTNCGIIDIKCLYIESFWETGNVIKKYHDIFIDHNFQLQRVKTMFIGNKVQRVQVPLAKLK